MSRVDNYSWKRNSCCEGRAPRSTAITLRRRQDKSKERRRGGGGRVREEGTKRRGVAKELDKVASPGFPSYYPWLAVRSASMHTKQYL